MFEPDEQVRGDYEPIPLAEARRAVAIARRVRGQLHKRLPRGAWEATRSRLWLGFVNPTV